MKTIIKDKRSHLYLLLSAFFIGNALLAELTGVKIFSLGKVVQNLFNGEPGTGLQTLPLNMSIGVVIWPLVFITSDILNEYFGRNGVRKISFITAALIAYTSIFLLTATRLPAADFWLENNRTGGGVDNFDINFAYNAVFRQGINIIVGSLTAFLVSQLIDAYAFQYFKKITGHRYLWLRATGSTVISQLIDSFLILWVAFNLLGNWSLSQVFQVGMVQYVYKVSLAILLTPVIYLMHYIIDRYLGKGSEV
ncbi:MAG: queuosine precursor transporter [Bacteroidales bacterium]|nr:queuosine precursor transporter [Bacteroidales bacterium]